MNSTPIRIALVVLLVLFAVLIAANLRPVDTLINEGPTLEVLQNDYLAAGKFLEGRGIEVEHRSYPAKVDSLPQDASLLLTSIDYLEGRQDKALALLEWVDSGGRLIWQYSPQMADSPLAQLLGITHHRYEGAREQETSLNEPADQDRATSLIETLQEKQAADEDPQPAPTEQVRLSLNRQESQAESGDISSLETPAGLQLQSLIETWFALALNDDSEAFEFWSELRAQSVAGERVDLMNFRLGQGQVTVVSDAGIWSNDRIGLFDHALLLDWLVQDSQQLYIQRYTRWPKLTELIRDNAAEAALVIFLLLIFWLLGKARRFEPMVSARNVQRRSLGEHVEAVADFHHQQRQFDVLLGPLRRQVLKRASRYHVGFDQLDEQAQHRLIADWASLPAEEVQWAMQHRESVSQTDLVRIVNLLHKLRNLL